VPGAGLIAHALDLLRLLLDVLEDRVAGAGAGCPDRRGIHHARGLAIADRKALPIGVDARKPG
jgi:hypothetical protein